MEIECCGRCGKPLEKKHIMLQVVEYLGDVGKRVPICEDCHLSYVAWMINGRIPGGLIDIVIPNNTEEGR